MKKDILLKCFLTGSLYAVITCIIQVPIANAIFSVLDLQSDTSISDERLLFLLLSLFVVGIAMAWFYYLYGRLFAGNSKWLSGLKFGLFIYLSNYIPQVFFLDVVNGITAFIGGGFPVVQVELFDFIILIITVLLLMRYMPYKESVNRNCSPNNVLTRRKCFWAGVVFAIEMVVLQEIVLPLLGIQGMAEGLGVSKENRLFFYGVMISGFILAGGFVYYYALKNRDIKDKVKNHFCLNYGLFIWCAFDLTMIPLGFGVFSTVIFIAVSLLGFVILDIICNLSPK